MIRDNLLKTQNKMKKFANKKRSKREFQMKDWIYLKLQSYRQSSLALRKNFELVARFYGPYYVIAKIGDVAYKL